MAILIWLIVAEALYVRALRVLGGRGVTVPRGQVACWHLGLGLQAIALLSPLGSLADDLLSAHMAEHLLLADLGAPLLLAGLRNPVLAFFLPRAGAGRRSRAGGGCGTRSGRCAGRWWRSPSTRSCSTAGTCRSRSRARCATSWSTSPSTRASSSPGSWSGGRRWSRSGGGCAASCGRSATSSRARMIGMFLGMAFVLIREPVYTGVYGSGERRGIGALADQQTAGAMMVALDILIMVFALAFFFWHAAQQHDRDEAAERARAAAGRRAARPRRPSAPARLLDRELALHAALAVAGHGAVERVLARLEVDLDRRRAAVLHDLALLVDAAAVDGDVVVGRLLVDRVDRERAGRAPRRPRTCR